MTDINLLPWRELKREQEKKQFTIIFAVMIGLAILVVFLMNHYINSTIAEQERRNRRLKNEIETFNRQIGEIKKLKELKSAFVSRMVVVQNLQATRPLTVHLFDELLKVLPDGLHIDTVRRSGNAVAVTGVAASNTNVSQMMRNIKKNKWIHKPVLTEIKKSRTKEGKEYNEFKLGFILQEEKPMDAILNGKN